MRLSQNNQFTNNKALVLWTAYGRLTAWRYMNRLIKTCVVLNCLILSQFAQSSLPIKTICTEHQNEITLTPLSSDKIGFKAVINKDIEVKEIREQEWFVLGVTCTNEGFEIKANRIQKNEKK